jgi:hypothetical protein
MINRDAILAELLEIESLLQDDRLNGTANLAKHLGAWTLAPGLADYRIDNRPSEAASLLLH